MNKKLAIGIIGAGRIGRVHAETLAFRLPQAAPLVIADVNHAAAAAVAAHCGIPAVASTADEILVEPRHRSRPHLLLHRHPRRPDRPAPPQPANTSSARSPSTTRSLISIALSPPSRKPASNSKSASTAASTPTSPASATPSSAAKSERPTSSTSSAATPPRRPSPTSKSPAAYFST